MRSPSLTVSAVLLGLLTGCSSITQSIAWRTQPFVRVPAPLPKGYDDHTNNVVKSQGWNFKHVVTCSTMYDPEAHWWMVYPDDPKRLNLRDASWLKLLFTGTALRITDWRAVQEATPEIAEACYAKFHVYPQMVQPELIFKATEVDKENARIKAEHMAIEKAEPKGNEEHKLRVGELPDGGWAKGESDNPPFNPLWHLGESYSQLSRAKREVRSATGSAGGGIRIGILDIGYSHNHLLVPKNTLDHNGHPGGDRTGEAIGDAINELNPGKKRHDILPGQTNGEHGMKTISILAGGALPVADDTPVKQPSIELGGAPDAVVVPSRVAPFVVSIATANLAYAIDYTSRVQHCGVISMSHGGAPSAMWIDAVNAAYDRGTAIFAATGDYYNIPPIELGIVAPSGPVFPAACRRVQSVAGLTANGTPYGQDDIGHYPLYYLNPLHWFTQRGSFGADGVHRDIFHMSLASMNAGTDVSQTYHGGIMRPQPISAFSPNIAGAQPPNKANGWHSNVLDLNFAGTSAATPQAAAAAALWLAKHRKEIENSHHWQDWRKAEAVYIAMLKTAGGLVPGEGTIPIDTRKPDKYCGAGSLKAADMLKVSFAEAQATHVNNSLSHNKQLSFPTSNKGIGRDFYDGQRSCAALLGLESQFPPYHQRALGLTDSPHVVKDRNSKINALTIIFYNQLLAEQWNVGRIPRKAFILQNDQSENSLEGALKKPKGWFVRHFSPDGEDLRKEAEEMAARVMHHP